MSGRPAIGVGPGLSGLLLLGLAAGPARAVDWPDVPVPEKAAGEIVSDHMIYNGISMRASRFTVQEPLSQVEQFYRSEWGKDVVATPLFGKTVLGHMEGGRYYVTVELTEDGDRTRGQVGVMQLPKGDLPPDAVGKGFGRLPNTQVSEDIVYMDTPHHVRTLSMVNDYSPLQNQRYYVRHFSDQGYVQDGSSSPCSDASTNCVSRFSRQDERITVTASRGRVGTVVVAVIE